MVPWTVFSPVLEMEKLTSEAKLSIVWALAKTPKNKRRVAVKNGLGCMIVFVNDQRKDRTEPFSHY